MSWKLHPSLVLSYSYNIAQIFLLFLSKYIRFGTRQMFWSFICRLEKTAKCSTFKRSVSAIIEMLLTMSNFEFLSSNFNLSEASILNIISMIVILWCKFLCPWCPVAHYLQFSSITGCKCTNSFAWHLQLSSQVIPIMLLTYVN